MILCALADVLGVAKVKATWPVDLMLHDPRYVRAARHDPEGKLVFADIRKVSFEPYETGNELYGTGDEFLSDWFVQEDGRLQWIADIYSRRKESRRLSSSIYLMVDCTRATAVDRCRPLIEASYGLGAGILYQEALAMSITEYVWYSREFVERRIAAHGFTAKNFAPS